MHVDLGGGLLYACNLETGDGAAETGTPVIAAASVPVSPFPTSLLFHSKPGAPNVLFLNFSGERVSGTEWNTLLARPEIPAVAFSTDTDYTAFSDAEQSAIKQIWMRVSEDYAPFNIDVTTERPATFGTRTAHALITRKTDLNGQPNPYSTAGGVAYVDVFAMSYMAQYRPAWIYIDNLSLNESYIAEATSHEIGHNMGLSHDGRIVGSTTNEYYDGHGSDDISWGPIMGTGYNRNISQWSKGEYYGANNSQDDLVFLANKMTYRTDDHADTLGAATALVITNGTNIVSTTPEADPANAQTVNKGILERSTDVDVFSFTTGTGSVSLTVKPWIMPVNTRGGNVDVVLELLDAAGTVLASNNAASLTTASLSPTLNGGLYYLRIRTTGAGAPFSSTPSGYTAYGGIGQYFISGHTAPQAAQPPPDPDPKAPGVTTGVVYSADMSVNPGWTLDPSWQYGAPAYPLAGPVSGFTGSSIIGYNLSGDYASGLSQKNATTPAIDCSAHTNLVLSFQRWLRVKNGDTASLEVSTNGLDWVLVWVNSGTVADSAWQGVQYPLPASVNRAAALRVRWGLASNNSQQDIGWNLDDVVLTGVAYSGASVSSEPIRYSLQVEVDQAGWGTVSVTNGLYEEGTVLNLEALANPYYRFAFWSGDVNDIFSSISVAMTTNISLTAHFSEITTTLYAVPHAWLASYGYRMFEIDVLSTGANGLPVWQSYIAGLDPTNPDSHYRFQGGALPGGFRIQWPTIPDRLYTILYTTNLASGFQPLPGAVDLPSQVSEWIDPVTNGSRFYKIDIRRP